MFFGDHGRFAPPSVSPRSEAIPKPAVIAVDTDDGAVRVRLTLFGQAASHWLVGAETLTAALRGASAQEAAKFLRCRR